MNAPPFFSIKRHSTFMYPVLILFPLFSFPFPIHNSDTSTSTRPTVRKGISVHYLKATPIRCVTHKLEGRLTRGTGDAPKSKVCFIQTSGSHLTNRRGPQAATSPVGNRVQIPTRTIYCPLPLLYLKFKSSLKQLLPPRWVQVPPPLAKSTSSMMVFPLLPALGHQGGPGKKK